MEPEENFALTKTFTLNKGEKEMREIKRYHKWKIEGDRKEGWE